MSNKARKERKKLGLPISAKPIKVATPIADRSVRTGWNPAKQYEPRLGRRSLAELARLADTRPASEQRRRVRPEPEPV